MEIQLLLCCAFLCAVPTAWGFASGAPDSACDDMVPQHHTPPQKSKFPYTVVANKKIIKPGDKVSIVISGSTVKEFKGFFIQARVGDTAIGKFSPGQGIKLVDCKSGKNNAATHSSPDIKNRIKLEWTAPPELTETVKFYTTVAKNGGEFWVKELTTTLDVKKQ